MDTGEVPEQRARTIMVIQGGVNSHANVKPTKARCHIALTSCHLSPIWMWFTPNAGVMAIIRMSASPSDVHVVKMLDRVPESSPNSTSNRSDQ